MKSCSAIRFDHALAVLALAFCQGCWEEVHYNPTQPAEVMPVLDTTTVDAAAVEPTPSETPTFSDVTSDELFAPDAAPPSEAEPTRVETEVSDQQFEPAPSAQVSGSSAESPETPDESSAMDTEWENAPSTPEVSDTPEVAVMRPSRTAHAAWRMSSRWSLAAAVYAKGQSEESYRDLLDQANYAASLIDIELPRFPTAAHNKLQTIMAGYMLHEGSEQFADELRSEYPTEYGALVEFAIKSHALLLIYTPKSQQLEPVVAAIRTAATGSGLPANYYEKLIGMLDRRESFADVKAEVLAMHASIGDYLSGE
jgi:hypothetical protein